MGDIHDFLNHRLASETATKDIRRLLHRAVRELSRGHRDAASALLLEANALEAATVQHQWALINAHERVSELAHEIHSFWERLADDRTLHDLADDASVLLELWNDLDRAQSRLLTLEWARP